ncbi:MAG: hypothetical protein MJ146_03040 [Clostridia bacterium]|nr:hypothetical protein [Clostridia bacterium]
MREFDHNGLLLAEYQGKLFEKSYTLECSTPIFIRRFLHSKLLTKLDTNNAANTSLDVDEGIRDINDQFGTSKYGVERYSKEALFWMGYMYRYIAYTREETTRFVMSIFSHRQMNEAYYVFHTQDPEWCTQNLLEMNGLSKYIFDKDLRLKEIIQDYYEG